jgi:hypothetical protein
MKAGSVVTPTLFVHRRVGHARSNRAGRADVHRAQEAQGAGDVHPLPGELSHRLVAVEYGPPLLLRNEMVE